MKRDLQWCGDQRFFWRALVGLHECWQVDKNVRNGGRSILVEETTRMRTGKAGLQRTRSRASRVRWRACVDWFKRPNGQREELKSIPSTVKMGWVWSRDALTYLLIWTGQITLVQLKDGFQISWKASRRVQTPQPGLFTTLYLLTNPFSQGVEGPPSQFSLSTFITIISLPSSQNLPILSLTCYMDDGRKNTILEAKIF